MDEIQNALESLKAGDTAYVEANHLPLEKVTIERLTNTLFIDTKDRKYRRSNGTRTGDDVWSTHRLYPSTPEMVTAYRRQRNLALVRSCKWETMSDEVLSQVAAILLKDK